MRNMKIYIGADHRGFALKEELKRYLVSGGYAVFDCGADAYDEHDDYPDVARAVAEQVSRAPDAHDAPDARGILICGSGAGVAIAANKIRGIRAATVHDARQARMVRADEDLNVCALPADFIDTARAKEIIDAFLTTPFSNEDRHMRRIAKIE